MSLTGLCLKCLFSSGWHCLGRLWEPLAGRTWLAEDHYCLWRLRQASGSCCSLSESWTAVFWAALAHAMLPWTESSVLCFPYHNGLKLLVSMNKYILPSYPPSLWVAAIQKELIWHPKDTSSWVLELRKHTQQLNPSQAKKGRNWGRQASRCSSPGSSEEPSCWCTDKLSKSHFRLLICTFI